MSRVRVFISHSARGDAVADSVRKAIHDRLKNDPGQKYAVLMDDVSLELGDVWRSRINLWIGACDAAVVIINRKAMLDADYVFYELSVLGYRWWRAQQEGKQFRIIPVLVGVTIEEIEKSRLRPSQVNEWMGSINGELATVAEEVVVGLDGVVAGGSMPIERMAKVLEARLPSTEGDLDQAALVLDCDLPWDAQYKKRFILATRLLGSGMSAASIAAVRRLRHDPTFMASNLGMIINLIAAAWVDLRAQKIRMLIDAEAPPALVLLNTKHSDLAKMYMRAVKYQEELELVYHLVEVGLEIDEKQDDPEYRKSILERVRQEIAQKLEVTADKVEQELTLVRDRKETVIVTIYAPLILQKTIAALTSAFKSVTFFFRTDSDIDLGDEDVYVIRPPFTADQEKQCRDRYGTFESQVKRPLGD